MKKRILKRLCAAALAVLTAAMLPQWGSFNRELMSVYAAGGVTVQASSLNVRSGAGTTYSKITSLYHGTQVTILEEVKGSDGAVWVKISYSGGTGYVQKAYLKTSVSNYSTDSDFESSLSNESFPESYKPLLREIHAQYPNWIFKAEHTGINWEEAVQNECVIGRNLVHESSRSSWKSTASGAFDWANNYWPGFDSSAWVAASEGVIRYYMDPRNFLDTSYVFQFLTQSYDSSTQTASGVETLAKGTFMEGKGSGSEAASESASAPGADQGTTPSVSEGPAAETGAPASGSSSSVGTVAPEAYIPPTDTSAQSSSPSQPSSGSTVTGVISGAPQARTAENADSGADDEFRYAEPSALDEGNAVLKADALGVVGKGKTSAVSDPTVSSGSSSASWNTSGTNYIDIIMEAAKQSGVNPYVLTSMIIQEQGTKGTSGLISGNSSGYPGIYNFFNVQAYADGNMNAVTRGLWWASQSGSYGRPWNSIAKAIIGGAVYYGENFIKTGQDTFYLKKFNVTGNSRYQHQYMTNVQGGASEGFELGQAYSEELKKTALVFRIPVYNDMPAEACTVPAGDGNPNNKLSGLAVNGFSLNESFQMDTQSYSLTVDPSVSSVTVSAKTIDAGASVSGTGTVPLSGDRTELQVSVKAVNGDVRTYTITVSRQSGGQTGNGEQPTFSSSSSSGSPSGSSGGPGVVGTSSSGTSASGGTVSAVSPSSGSSGSAESSSPGSSSPESSGSGDQVSLSGPPGT